MLQRPFKLLIVDDEPEVANVLSDCIKDLFPEAFDITIKIDAVEAFNYIKTERVLIAITDVNMPKINGDDLNLKIKGLHQGVRTIILTGGSSYMTAITCFRDGADGYISKPFQIDEIDETIQRTLDLILSWEKVFKKVTYANKKTA